LKGVFDYRGDALFADGLSLRDAVEAVPTPFYLYVPDELVRRYQELCAAFASVPHTHCVALKANSQPALLRPLFAEGAGAEVVSGAELRLALELGVAPDRIVFSGVGKTERELERGLLADIRMFLVESKTELEVLDRLARQKGRRARVALRLNPDIDPETHPHIATGVSTAKFGLDLKSAEEVYGRHDEFTHLDFVGVHSHIGSQITSIEPLGRNAEMLARWVRSQKERGVDLKYVDIGGGLGIRYRDESAPSFRAYAERVIPAFSDLEVEIVTEPGRALFGPIGSFIVRVLYVKQVHGRTFVVVDAGLNDLLRPALYGAYHPVVPIEKKSGQTVIADIAGAVCESSDVFARDRELVTPERGDYLAILHAGAYGFAMSSNYNLRPRPAEVTISNGELRVVRRAETEDQLVARELGTNS
jgi:diaminopimelate decarboxylase